MGCAWVLAAVTMTCYLQMYKEAVTVGYAFEEQLFDAIPSEAHDRRLDFVVTQKECYEAEYSRM